jgi:hypothetical protein
MNKSKKTKLMRIQKENQEKFKEFYKKKNEMYQSIKTMMTKTNLTHQEAVKVVASHKSKLNLSLGKSDRENFETNTSEPEKKKETIKLNQLNQSNQNRPSIHLNLNPDMLVSKREDLQSSKTIQKTNDPKGIFYLFSIK